MTSIFLDTGLPACSLSLERGIESLKIDTVESDFYVRVSRFIFPLAFCVSFISSFLST